MNHTPPTSPTPRPTFGEIVEEVVVLSGGLVVGLLPLFVLSVPGIILFFVLPALLLLALALPFVVIGTLLAAPAYLLARRRRPRRRASGLRRHHPALG